jgi:hypothetical protein
MKSCSEYTSLADRYADLEPNLKASLDAHLESCGRCAERKADADRAMQLLRMLRKPFTPTEPIDQALERLSLRLAASKRQMLWALVLVATCIAAPFGMLLRGDLPPTVWGLLVLTAAGAAISAWQVRRKQSALLRLTERPGGFYATWQRDLEKGVRMLTGGRMYVTVWSIGFFAYSMLGPFGIVERLVVLGAAFLLAFGALHTFVIELPQLKSELRLVRDAIRG